MGKLGEQGMYLGIELGLLGLHLILQVVSSGAGTVLGWQLACVGSSVNC